MVKGLIDIVIVNWNAGELLQKAVNSIFSSSYSNFFIHIVDNASTDDSISSLPNDHRIKIYYNNKNLGFGRACNSVLTFLTGEFVLLINPDTTVRTSTLKTSIDYLTNNSNCTVYGCAQLDENGLVQKVTVGRFPNPITFCNEVLGLSTIAPNVFKNGFISTDWHYTSSDYVSHVMGSFYLIRRSWVQQHGLFDDRFFVYLEDLDLSKRVINSKGMIFYDSSNSIYHKQGGSSEKVKAKRLFYSLHAKHEYIKKYFPALAFIFCNFAMLVPGFFVRIFHAIAIERNYGALKESIAGYWLLYKHLFIKKQF